MARFGVAGTARVPSDISVFMDRMEPLVVLQQVKIINPLRQCVFMSFRRNEKVEIFLSNSPIVYFTNKFSNFSSRIKTGN